MQDRPKFMLGRATPSSGQAQKRPPKHERESTAGPACEKLGFRRLAAIPNYPQGHEYIMYIKYLPGASHTS